MHCGCGCGAVAFNFSIYLKPVLYVEQSTFSKSSQRLSVIVRANLSKRVYKTCNEILEPIQPKYFEEDFHMNIEKTIDDKIRSENFGSQI